MFFSPMFISLSPSVSRPQVDASPVRRTYGNLSMGSRSTASAPGVMGDMAMASTAAAASGATKWDIRKKVWDYIEANNLANFPRPVHNRIPNFKGAAQACNQLKVLQEFKSSSVVKVNPDKPQEQARFCTLEAKKTLLVPTPRLRTGLFNKIIPPQGASKEDLRVCSTSQGVKDFSVPIGLDAKVKVDLVVVGSVAVSEKGYRIGKGEGFADMEYAMMVAMGAVNESTVVATVVHDCQVVDISEDLIEIHDLTVDYILTPTRVIKTGCTHPKPPGIIWSKIDTDMLEKIPILKKLRALEQEAGKDVTLNKSPEGGQRAAGPRTEPRSDPKRDLKGPSERRRPKEGQSEEVAARRGGGGGVGGRGGESVLEPRAAGQAPVTTVYLGNIPAGVRVSELKSALREREAVPLRLTWQGAQHRAFLDYAGQQAADRALAALEGLSIHEHTLQPELAKSQRGDRRPGQAHRRRSKTSANTAAATPDNTTTTGAPVTDKPKTKRPTPKRKVENLPPS
ncbi:methenyltetrahydrofolate synthase domain-containing protein isoform X2 [Alosa alosa]|uniref:methenyltetrahydrofolate synthase domain-containing protein isoform X2 n=1 Tax=Alosa alosa TaxID=278164 RepID=UPI002015476F|nr:methenyltetrahydrofolate synthase domain-containing protein isoform X2 [Alosa alosa]